MPNDGEDEFRDWVRRLNGEPLADPEADFVESAKTAANLLDDGSVSAVGLARAGKDGVSSRTVEAVAEAACVGRVLRLPGELPHDVNGLDLLRMVRALGLGRANTIIAWAGDRGSAFDALARHCVEQGRADAVNGDSDA